MKILKNAGRFEVLALMCGMNEGPIQLIERAGRTCYQSQDKITAESAKKFVLMLRKRGHESVLEHSYMTVQFNDVCRGFTHELVRHRLCSFSQESTRYVDESDFKVVVPPHKDENERVSLTTLEGHKITLSIREWFSLNEAMYRKLREVGWKPEDARQVLPIAIKSQIVVSANLREWRHIFKMRTSKAAHWEIRRVMINLLQSVQNNIPVLFDDFKVIPNTLNVVGHAEMEGE